MGIDIEELMESDGEGIIVSINEAPWDDESGTISYSAKFEKLDEMPGDISKKLSRELDVENRRGEVGRIVKRNDSLVFEDSEFERTIKL
ncbi:hypothetical protein [Halobaculum gomorrense]|uniref:hypothetical protein n=1 Tax=Halobaculum gomorrense TaxID=43928 RepID=UPI001160EFC9|nr:hypothetical protein [Halobaculum gomorrense]